MKYYETLIEDQETTISLLYKEQKVKVYSSEPKTIQKLIKALGKPSTRYIKSKTYWSGASWEIDFDDIDKLKEIIVRDAFIDTKTKKNNSKNIPKTVSKSNSKKVDKVVKRYNSKRADKIEKKSKPNFEQIQFGL